MDQISQIREKIDIVAFIQEYLPLKKAGRNFKTNCPFHADKTPSFIVSPQRQIWHCFSCGRGGDCFSFLMEYEHVEFPESLRILADKAGIQLQNQRFDSGISSKKETMYGMNRLAAEFYHYLLTKHQLGKKALQYVLGRKVKSATINTYVLGFSPRGSSLVTYLSKKKKYAIQDILDAGLATRRGRDVIDFFQGRLMFPLFDHRGNIIGFSGRILDVSNISSKYINTRETLIYHKGLTFFGLNSAKESIKEKETAILMEGEFDVISAFQEGITNAVAVKGTAVTENQVQLLSRFCKKVQLCFDMDSAGQDALVRSLPLLEKKGLTTTVILLTNGKDADESIKNNPVIFKQAMKHDIGVYDYLLDKVTKKYDTKTPYGKKQIGDEMLPILAGIENEIVKEHYLQLLGKEINTSYEALIKAIEKLKKETVVRKDIVMPRTIATREENLEQYLVALLIQSPYVFDLLQSLQLFITQYIWHSTSFGKILSHVEKFLQGNPKKLAQDSISSMPQELLPQFDTCFLLPLPTLSTQADWKVEVVKTADELLDLSIKEQLRVIGQEIFDKEKEGNPDEIVKLQTEFTRLAEKLKPH